ncbi:MAG: hypothetical protein D6830_01255 [Ignavibacteria bacterium]|nr:MAG: hypothetical protein D6830_01255 [Ignavibacteria bacterium]
MKALKTILYIIIGIVALFLIIALFLPSQVRVERSIVIEKPAAKVYNLVIDFNNYKKWNPWSQMDPKAKGTLEGQPATVGQKWSWDGELVGKGSMTLKEFIPNKMIKSELKFIEPFESKSWDLWTFEPVDGGTKVVWANESEVDYPVGRYFGLFFEDMMGPDFDKGLKNLKKLAESTNPVEGEVETIDAKEQKMLQKETEKKEAKMKEKSATKKDMVKKSVDYGKKKIMTKGKGF